MKLFKDWPVYLLRRLRADGITTIEDLLVWEIREVLRIPGIGLKKTKLIIKLIGSENSIARIFGDNLGALEDWELLELASDLRMGDLYDPQFDILETLSVLC
jgi:hypothetical protein